MEDAEKSSCARWTESEERPASCRPDPITENKLKQYDETLSWHPGDVHTGEDPDVMPTLVPSGEASQAMPIPVDAAQASSVSDKSDGTGFITGPRLVLALAGVNLCAFLTFLDNSILSTATPTITDEFHSVQDLGWYVSSYQLALSALQPLTGKLFTYLPNKWTYIFFVLLFELGSLICGVATSSRMLIGGRAAAGLGASGLMNGALTIIAALVPLQKRPAVTGLLMGVGQLGLIGGPLIGGALTQYTTWRWCFYINLPIGGLAVAVLAIIHIPEQAPKPPLKKFLSSPSLFRKFDLVGMSILVPAVVMLLLALHYGGSEYPWNSPTVIGLFCGFGVVGILFVGWEWRVGEDAMIPLSMFRERVVVAGCLTNLCLFGCTFVSAYFLPIYFQSIQGSSPFVAGIHMLPSIIAQLVMAVVSGFAVSKMGYYLPWSVSSAVLSSVGSGLIATWSSTTAMGEWIGYQVILGIGRGAGIQMAFIAVQSVLPQSQLAVALAVLVFIQGLGCSILISVANTIFDNSLKSEIVSKAPGVNAQAVIAAGATSFRGLVSKEELPNVLKAYASSFDRTFYVVIGLSCATFITSWGLGNHDVRKKPNLDSGDAAEDRHPEKDC